MFRHLDWLKATGFEPLTIIDIGAHTGDWTKRAMQVYPAAQFIMIEPQPSKIGILKKLADLHDQVIFQSALLGKTCQKKVIFYDMENRSSIFQETSKQFEKETGKVRKKIYLEMITLDKLLANKPISTPGLMKLDVQGSELDILIGGRDTLKYFDFVLLETSLLNFNEGAPQIAEVIQQLTSIDFQIFDILDPRRNEKGRLMQVDIIFINKQSRYYDAK